VKFRDLALPFSLLLARPCHPRAPAKIQEGHSPKRYKEGESAHCHSEPASNKIVGLGFHLLAALTQEVDAHVVTVHPSEFATAIGEPGRREQKEELLQVQPFYRTLDDKGGSGIGDFLESAWASPSAVDSHDLDCDRL